MKTLSRYLLIIGLILSLIGCAANSTSSPTAIKSSDDQRALQVLVAFLENLNAGKYDEAALVYGGTYETMKSWNPDIDPGDHSVLLRNACTINGVQCLQIKSLSLEKKVSDTEFVFKVEFLNGDGTLFVLGPCCGGNATDSPPQSVFHLTVMKVDDNKFAVMDMPPYAP